MEDGTCEVCPAYQYVSEDLKQCLTKVCIDETEVINADGTCHDYDPTLPGRHEALTQKQDVTNQYLTIKVEENEKLVAEKEELI